MKKIKSLSAALFLLCLLNCSEDELRPYEQSLLGTWRLYEVGISPGSGYIITEVPEKPPQLMTFAKRGELTQQGAQSQMEYFFKGYNRYRLDPNQYDTSIIFSNRGKDEFQYHYQLSAQNDTLTLSPPCIEGCHFGFVKIK